MPRSSKRSVSQQDSWAQSRGQIAQGLIQVYRSLGGGWQIKLGPPPDKQGILSPLPVVDHPAEIEHGRRHSGAVSSHAVRSSRANFSYAVVRENGSARFLKSCLPNGIGSATMPAGELFKTQIVAVPNRHSRRDFATAAG